MSIGSTYRPPRVLSKKNGNGAIESTAVVRFAEFEADLRTGELFRGKVRQFFNAQTC